jgi:cell division protein FtsB
MGNRNLSKAEVEKRRRNRKRLFVTLSLAGALYFLVPLLLGDMGLVKYFGMLKTDRELSREIETLVGENDRLRDEIRALRTDPTAIEKIAREELGMVKDGELVYRFKSEEK